MSNALSIATVTAVIKNLLENGLVSDAIAASVGDVLVTALPPDKIQVGSDERAQINLFLYHVTQNRNVDWISQEYRNRYSTTRTANPPLALDLHYVLTAYGAKDFQAEILLGYAMQMLHKLPIITSNTIENALKNAAETSTSSVFSQAIANLSVSNLALRLGQIKVSSAFLTMEETSRIWSALQTNYRPSATYQVSMVMINSDNIDELDNSDALQLSEPTIEQITAPTSQAEATITIGSTILIRGKRLRGDITKVRLSNIDKLFTPFDVQDTQVSLQVPPDLRAGIQSVQIIHETIKNPEHNVIESNVMPFVLHPKISVVLHSTEMTIKLMPKVGKDQRVLVLLNQISKNDPATYSYLAPTPTEDTDTITIPLKNMKPGEYLVRVKVDGAESALYKNQSGEYELPQITIK